MKLNPDGIFNTLSASDDASRFLAMFTNSKSHPEVTGDGSMTWTIISQEICKGYKNDINII